MMRDKFFTEINVGDTILFCVNWLGAATIRFGRVKSYINDYIIEVVKVDFGRESLNREDPVTKVGPVVRLSRSDSIIVISPTNPDLPKELAKILSDEHLYQDDDNRLRELHEDFVSRV